jgi:hypothetical protein
LVLQAWQSPRLLARASSGDRKAKIIATWRVIVELLEGKISGTSAMLPIPPPNARGWEMKAFEDQLDAVVCAWVGAARMYLGVAVSITDCLPVPNLILTAPSTTQKAGNSARPHIDARYCPPLFNPNQ